MTATAPAALERLRAWSPWLGWLLGSSAVGLGAWLRWQDLGAYWLNPDEGIYYSIATRPELSLALLEIERNAHPPLFYLLLRGLVAFNTDPGLLRCCSALFGTLSVAAVWLLGRALGGSTMGVCCALLLAVSPGAIEQSQVIRPYTLHTALLALCLWCLVRHERQRQLRDAIGFGAVLLLAAATHYSTMMPAVAAGGVLLAGVWRSDRWGREALRVGLCCLPAAALMIWGVLAHIRPYSGKELMAAYDWLDKYYVHDAGQAWQAIVGVFQYFAGSQAGLAVIGFAVGLVLAVFGRGWLLLWLSCTVLGLGVLLACLGKYPLGATRHVS
jgi:uncharacterized membrane protein